MGRGITVPERSPGGDSERGRPVTVQVAAVEGGTELVTAACSCAPALITGTSLLKSMVLAPSLVVTGICGTALVGLLPSHQGRARAGTRSGTVEIVFSGTILFTVPGELITGRGADAMGTGPDATGFWIVARLAPELDAPGLSVTGRTGGEKLLRGKVPISARTGSIPDP